MQNTKNYNFKLLFIFLVPVLLLSINCPELGEDFESYTSNNNVDDSSNSKIPSISSNDDAKAIWNAIKNIVYKVENELPKESSEQTYTSTVVNDDSEGTATITGSYDYWTSSTSYSSTTAKTLDITIEFNNFSNNSSILNGKIKYYHYDYYRYAYSGASSDKDTRRMSNVGNAQITTTNLSDTLSNFGAYSDNYTSKYDVDITTSEGDIYSLNYIY